MRCIRNACVLVGLLVFWLGCGGGGSASAPPVISSNPGDVLAVSGTTVTFTAAATGTPAPTVQWQRKTTAVGAVFTDIPGATSIRVQVDLGRFGGLVAQPKGDHAQVHAPAEEVHGRRMPQRVRRHMLSRQSRTGPAGVGCVSADEGLQRICA